MTTMTRTRTVLVAPRQVATYPPPVRFADYTAALPESVIGTVMGPNTLGEVLTVVSATQTATGTRLGFAYGAWALMPV